MAKYILTESQLRELISGQVGGELDESWRNWAMAGAMGAASMFAGNAQAQSRYTQSDPSRNAAVQTQQNELDKKLGSEVTQSVSYRLMRNGRTSNRDRNAIVRFLSENPAAIRMFQYLDGNSAGYSTQQREQAVANMAFRAGGIDKAMGLVVGEWFVVMPASITLAQLQQMYANYTESVNTFDIR